MSEGSKFVLIDLSGLPDASAKVACRLMDMLEHAAGYIAPSRVARDAKYKAEAAIIEEIAGKTDWDPVVRLATISNLKKSVKEYKNQTKIVSGAIPFVEDDAKPEEVEEDWFALFMDKARLVSSEELQLIWSRLLAQETNKPGSVSKQLLFILYQMTIEEATIFMNLVPFCVDVYDGEEFKENHPVIDYVDDEFKESYGISYDDITTLESLGLLQYDVSVSFVVNPKKVAELKYNDEVILTSNWQEKTRLGSVAFTKTGRELFKICERKSDAKAYKYVKEALELFNVSKNDILS